MYNMMRLQNASVDLNMGANLLKIRERGALSQPPPKMKLINIKELIETDARYTVEELAQISGISSSSVYRILTD